MPPILPETKADRTFADFGIVVELKGHDVWYSTGLRKERQLESEVKSWSHLGHMTEGFDDLGWGGGAHGWYLVVINC